MTCNVENLWTTSEGKKWLKEMLTENVVCVTFVKKDGNTRIMNCTLNSDKIPAAPVTEGVKKERKVSDDSIAVYDTEANGWRSFRFDSVTGVSFGTDVF